MAFGLRKEQPRTLVYIWEYVKQWNRVPTARELCEELGLEQQQTAYMRIVRLRNDGYLVRREDGTWTLNDAEVVTQPETASFLLKVQKKCAQSASGKLKRNELSSIARQSGISLASAELDALLQKLVSIEYLSEPEFWAGYYRIGTRVHKEHEYLKLLAERLQTETRPARKKRVKSRSKTRKGGGSRTGRTR